MDSALIVVFALLLNAAFGGPRALYEATSLVRLGRIPAKLLRDHEPKYNQPGKHILLIAYTLIIACALGLILRALFMGDLKFLEVALLATLLPVRPAFERALQIRNALAKNDIALARKALEGTVWKHHVLLDAHGVARAAIELMAVNFSEKILAPLIWYLLFGLPGLFVCKAIGLLKESLPASFNAGATIDQLTLRFGTLVSWIASRLASILWIAVSVVFPTSNIGKTVDIFMEKGASLSFLPYELFTAATVLGLSLGGPTSAYVNTEWFGAGSPKATHADVRRALMVYAALFVLLLVLLGPLL